MDEPERERPISPSRLSKTPSWITLGFVLGALFVYSLPREDKSARPNQQPSTPPQVQRLERPKISDIEAVFEEWGRYAQWADDITQVALWDTEKHDYSIFYEVFRYGGNYYFRSISRIQRFVSPEEIRLPPNSPLRFARMLVGDLPAPRPAEEKYFRPEIESAPPKRRIPLEQPAPGTAPIREPKDPVKPTP
jgi:hypothetical protein